MMPVTPVITSQTPSAVGCNACGGYHLQPATADDWHALRTGYVDALRSRVYRPHRVPNSAYAYEYGQCLGIADSLPEKNSEHLTIAEAWAATVATGQSFVGTSQSNGGR